MDPDLLAGLRALVDTNRLRIVARVGAKPATVEDLAMELRQPVPSVARQVDVLVAAGLVERTGDRHDNLRARFDRVGELARQLASLESGGGSGARWRGRRPERRLAARRRVVRRDPRADGRDRRRRAGPAVVPRRRAPGDDPRPAPQAPGRPAVPARARVRRGPRVPREGGQPAARAVPPGRRGAPALPRRRRLRHPRGRPLPPGAG